MKFKINNDNIFIGIIQKGDNMKCPKCKLELNKGICLKCGYMENGYNIERNKENEKYKDIRIYNEDFDIMNQNSTKLLNLLLGPFYFSYRNHLFIGILISIIDLLILTFEINFQNALTTLGSIYNLFAFFNIVLYPIVNRMLYMGFSNVICIKIDEINIKKIKKQENYIQKLEKHKNRSWIKIIINLVIYVIMLGFLLKG